MSETIIKTMETVQPEAAEPVKPYTFRTLGGGDVFLMFRIISKIGLKEFNACLENDGIKNLVANMMVDKAKKTEAEAETDVEAEAETDVEAEAETPSVAVTYISVMLEVADVLFSNISKCESEVFQMLSQTSNLSVAQVKRLPLAQFTEMVIDFIKKEEFRDFIKVVSRLFK